MLRKKSVWLRMWGVALLWLLMFALPAFPDIAREPRIEFEHITLEEGLFRNTISSIVQDQLGFLWVGTADGLFRYDGYQFKAYLHDPDNPRSVSHNRITALCADRSGLLWVGTNGGGLNAFSPETEQFQTYQPDPDNPQYVVTVRGQGYCLPQPNQRFDEDETTVADA